MPALCFALEELRFHTGTPSEVFQESLQIGFRLGWETFVWLKLEFGEQSAQCKKLWKRRVQWVGRGAAVALPLAHFDPVGQP